MASILAVGSLDVLLDELLELLGDALALERRALLGPSMYTGATWALAGAGRACPQRCDVGVLALARAVHGRSP